MPLVSVDVDRLAVYRAFAFASSSSEAQHQQQAAGGWGPDENGSFGLLPLSSPHRHTAITSMPVSMLSALSAVSLDTHATRPKNQASGGHEKETRAKAVEDWSVATTQTILRPAQAASLGSLPPLRPPIDFGTPTRISFRSSHRGKGFLDCLLPPTQATLDALCPPPLAPPLFLSPFESLPPLFNILPLCIGPGASIQTRGEAAALFHLTEALDQTIQTSSDGHTTTPFALAALLRVQDALATLSPSGVPGRSGGRLKKGELFEAVVAAGEPALRELLTHPGLLAERANLLEKAVSHSSESVNSPMHSPTASRRQRNDARISSAAAGFVDALLRCLLQNATAPVLFPPNFSRLLYKNIPLTECISVKPRSHTWGQKTKRETGDSLGHAVGPSDIFTGLLCRQLTSIQNKPHSPSPHGNLQTPNPFRAPSSSLRVPPGLTNQSSGSLPPLIGRGAFCLLGLGIPKKHHVGRGRRPRTVADLLQESRWGAETSRRGSKETDLASGRQQGRQEMPEYCSNPVGLLFYWRWADGQSYDPKDISKCGRDGRVVTEVGGRAAQLVWPLENGTPIDCEDMWGDKAPASGSLRVGAGVSVEALSDVGEDGGLSVLGGVEAVRIQEGGKGENISAAMAREATEAGDAGREQGWTFEMWLRMPLRAGEGVSVRSPSVSSSLNLFSVGTGLSLLYHLESNKLLLQTGAGQEDRERGRGRRFSSEGRRPSFFRSFVFQRHQNGQGEDGGGGGRRDEPLIPLGRWTHIGLRVPWSGGPVEACVSTSSLELAALNREGEGERNETLLVCPELPGDSLRGSLGCAPRIGGGGMIYFEATEVRLWGVCLSAAAIASQRGRVLPCATAERGTTRLRRLRWVVEGETPSSTSAAPLPPPSNTRSTPPFGRGLPSPVAPPSSSEPPARLPAKAGVNHTPSPMAPHSTTHKHPAERQTGTRLLPQKHSSPTGPAAAPPTVALPVHLPRALQEDEIKPRNFGEMSPITKRVFEVPLSYRPHPRTDPADPLPTSPVSRRALRAKERMRIAPPDSLARIGLTGSALYREVLGLLSEEVRRLWVEEGEAVVDAEECRRARRRRRRRELWRRFRRHTGQAEEDPFGLEFLDDGEQEREEKGEGGLAEVVEAEREGQEVEEDVSEGEEERQNQQETTQAEKALRAWIPSEGEISALISRAVESVSSTPSAALEGDSLKGTHSDFLEISRQGLGVSLGSRFWVCESSVRIGVAGLGCLTTLAGWPRPLYLPAVRESAVHTGLSEVPIPLSGDAKGRLRTAASPVKYRDRQRERERVGARWTKDDEASESAAACQTFDKMVEDGVVDYAARKADEAGVFFRSALNTVSTFVKSRSFLTADSASESVQRLQLDAQTLEALRPPPDIWMRLRAGAVLCTACRVAAVAKEFGRNGVHPVYRGLLLVVSCFLSERLRDIVTEMDQVESLKSQLTALARVGGGTSLPRALQRFRLETEAQTAAASFVGGDWDHCSRLAKEVSDEDLGLIVLKKELRQRVRFRWGTEAERDPTKTFEECRTGLLSRSVRRGIVIMAAITQSPQCRAEMHSRVLSASLASSSLTLPIPLNGVCVRQRSGGGEEMEKETQTEREKVVKATTKVTREVCGQSLSWSRSGGMHCPVCENESPISDGARRKEWGGPKARRPRLLLCWVTLRRFEADRLRRCPLCEAEIDSQAVKDHECLCPVCGVGQLPPVPRLSDGTLAVSAMSCPT
uniref:Uncharacterized protein n=1 Tax=Chromera velia CCMP2878 TaxID=1169474 RepID=A0A0G4FDL8_9ALVE|eukprot:Cvel_3205.t1-p1 / transcript=Cvel_3205.t1 / gene=Cvel_3205 / organism=Chromera_velia_CCMP2878 / gene_product=hypothetical protein / transcript_product=hypothetical protein / location=Cvel_scaffold125:51143-59039(-) / protein_length=1718 / sequence_SO=supercontig / SO=protein_coding / is_pseudo=false